MCHQFGFFISLNSFYCSKQDIFKSARILQHIFKYQRSPENKSQICFTTFTSTAEPQQAKITHISIVWWTNYLKTYFKFFILFSITISYESVVTSCGTHGSGEPQLQNLLWMPQSWHLAFSECIYSIWNFWQNNCF